MTNPTFDFTDRPYIKAAAEHTRAEIDRLNNPHTFRVTRRPRDGYGDKGWVIVNQDGEEIEPARFYATYSDASDAIGEMIADDDADRRLNRHRHESMGD